MKLNQDCMRAVILYLEDNLGLNTIISDQSLLDVENFQNFPPEDVIYSVRQLYKSGLLEAIEKDYIRPGKRINVIDITPKGHEFCDYVRNEDNWNKAKPKLLNLSSIDNIMSILSNIFNLAVTAANAFIS